jgi:hypothetical protein
MLAGFEYAVREALLFVRIVFSLVVAVVFTQITRIAFSEKSSETKKYDSQQPRF